LPLRIENFHRLRVGQRPDRRQREAQIPPSLGGGNPQRFDGFGRRRFGHAASLTLSASGRQAAIDEARRQKFFRAVEIRVAAAGIRRTEEPAKRKFML
jgi:hypothetical protein